VKKPKTRSGARKSAATFARKTTSRVRSVMPRPRKAAAATASRAFESHDGPRKDAPVEMMPVAITNAK
jgi:hypothetical protein